MSPSSSVSSNSASVISITSSGSIPSLCTLFPLGVKYSAVVIFNATPVVYHDYAIGVPGNRDYVEIINSDYEVYGGSGQYNGGVIKLIKEPMHSQPNQIKITVPPLGVAVFKMKKRVGRKPKAQKKETK